jgi:hypothetical protein
VPILAVLTAVPQLGSWVANWLVTLASKLGILGNFRFAVFALSLSGIRNGHGMPNFMIPRNTTSDPLIFWIPTFILAVIQSYRMFKAPIRDGARVVARNLSPLVLLALLCSASIYTINGLSNWATAEVLASVYDVNRAMQGLLSDSANRDAAQPLQPSVDELKITSPHSYTLRWFHGSTFTVVPDKAHPTTCCVQFLHSRAIWNYNATAHLASGADLTLSFEPSARLHGIPGLQIRVRWPGKTSEQILMDEQ